MNKLHFLLAGFLLLPVFLLSARTNYLMTADRVELSILVRNKLVLVEGTVNGQTGYFLLDTGVGRLTLNDRVFREESTPTARVVSDVNGIERQIRETFVSRFSFGPLFREDFYAQVVDLRVAERVLEIPLLGLIGHEVIKAVELRLDYDNRRLEIYRLDEVGEPIAKNYDFPDHRIPFSMERHIPTIDISVDDKRRLRMGVDTGSSLNVVDKTWRKRLAPRALRRHKITYNAALSTERVDYFTMPSLNVANELALIHSKVAVNHLGNLFDNRIHVDGLIGIDLFRLGTVSLNYQKGEFAIWVNDNVFAMKYRPLGP